MFVLHTARCELFHSCSQCIVLFMKHVRTVMVGGDCVAVVMLLAGGGVGDGGGDECSRKRIRLELGRDALVWDSQGKGHMR